jgi:asparagine synthase (glutamine-hydrolysing)
MAAEGDHLPPWIGNDLRELVDDVLLNGELVAGGFLQRPALNQLVADERSGREDRSKQIWQLLTLETWCRHMRSLGVSISL